LPINFEKEKIRIKEEKKQCYNSLKEIENKIQEKNKQLVNYNIDINKINNKKELLVNDKTVFNIEKEKEWYRIINYLLFEKPYDKYLKDIEEVMNIK